MQGIGAAFSQTASLAMVSSVFPDSVATTTVSRTSFSHLSKYDYRSCNDIYCGSKLIQWIIVKISLMQLSNA